MESIMHTTRPFMSGRSQTARIPKEYRFEDTELIVNRIGQSLVITPKDAIRGIWRRDDFRFGEAAYAVSPKYIPFEKRALSLPQHGLVQVGQCYRAGRLMLDKRGKNTTFYWAYEQYGIWGLTARLLVRFRDMLLAGEYRPTWKWQD